MTDVTNIDDRDAHLAALLDELTEAMRLGQAPQLEEVARHHPDLAAEQVEQANEAAEAVLAG